MRGREKEERERKNGIVLSILLHNVPKVCNNIRLRRERREGEKEGVGEEEREGRRGEGERKKCLSIFLYNTESIPSFRERELGEEH